MGLPRLGGCGGNGGDVWVVTKHNMTLRKIRDACPRKRFVAGNGENSRLVPQRQPSHFTAHLLAFIALSGFLC